MFLFTFKNLVCVLIFFNIKVPDNLNEEFTTYLNDICSRYNKEKDNNLTAEQLIAWINKEKYEITKYGDLLMPNRTSEIDMQIKTFHYRYLIKLCNKKQRELIMIDNNMELLKTKIVEFMKRSEQYNPINENKSLWGKQAFTGGKEYHNPNGPKLSHLNKHKIKYYTLEYDLRRLMKIEKRLNELKIEEKVSNENNK